MTILREYPTRVEAREWLLKNYFDPVAPSAEIPAPGVWWDASGQMVQAFKNCSGGWTVQEYKLPNLDHYIS